MKVQRTRSTREDGAGNLRRILANTTLFRSLKERELDEIAGATSPIRAVGNSSVVNQGDMAKGVYLVVYGQVKVGFERKDGSEKTLVILGQNKCFGLAEMLLGQRHQTFVKTTGDAMLLHVPREQVMEAARKNFAFAEELMTCVGRQFCTLVRDIESYSLQSARQRLAGYLLRHSEYQNDDCIELVASKMVVASRLSLTPETLSRLLHDLAMEGTVKVTGRRVRIVDSEKLTEILTA